MMTKTTHTHRGTCQSCGSVQAVDNATRKLAKHGYKVEYHQFMFVCNAAGLKPAEHDVTYTHETIAYCIESAVWLEGQIPKLKSGEVVPDMFERWNPNKVVTRRRRRGGTYEEKGGYDTLPIEQATATERRDRINGQISHHEHQAKGYRAHADFLHVHVLPRLGQPLYPNEELAKTALTKGMRFTYNGADYELTRPAYSTFGNRYIGWYVRRVGAEAKHKLRWTTKQIREAINPKPAKVEGAYATKQARKDDLDKLNREYDKARKAIQDMYLALPHAQRTEAKTAIYYGPTQLNHWRPKHAEATVREFPQATAIVERINELVKEREAVKSAP